MTDLVPAAPRTLRLTLAYDGSDFFGWQFQPAARTVQGVLETALHQVTGQRVATQASGRTDAGVHALGQVVSLTTNCRLPCEVFLRAINAHLPDDVRVLEVREARPGFHATNDARRKRYCYVLHDGPRADVFRRKYCWKLRDRLDVRAMQAAADVLQGTHDFASFQSSGSPRASTVRTITCLTVQRRPCAPEASFAVPPTGDAPLGDLVHVEVEADGFLYNMVRTIVGMLREVGRGNGDAEWVRRVLAARDRRQAARTAPPQGLFLVSVTYDE